jgi:hypothetical protein
MSLGEWLDRHAPSHFTTVGRSTGRAAGRALFAKLAAFQTHDPQPLELDAATFLENCQANGRNRYATLYLKAGLSKLLVALQDLILAQNPLNSYLDIGKASALVLQSELESAPELSIGSNSNPNSAANLSADSKTGLWVGGVRLANGETIQARTFISSLAPTTLQALWPPAAPLPAELARAASLPASGAGVASLTWVLALRQALPFATPTLYDLTSLTTITNLSYYNPSLLENQSEGRGARQILEFKTLLPLESASNWEQDQSEDQSERQAQLMQLADAYLPGWSQAKLSANWILELDAVKVRRTPTQLEQLLPLGSQSNPNLFYVGEWVHSSGSFGIGAEAACASAEAAAVAADAFLKK